MCSTVTAVIDIGPYIDWKTSDFETGTGDGTQLKKYMIDSITLAKKNFYVQSVVVTAAGIAWTINFISENNKNIFHLKKKHQKTKAKTKF